MTTTTNATANPSSALFSSLNGTPVTGKNSVSETESRFYKLLTAQLKNQDPLNPVDNAQMTAQTAQISTVSGIEKLNQTLKSLIADSANSQALQSAALIGKGVLVPGNSIGLQGGSAFGGIDLPGDADSVSIDISDSNGLPIRTLNLGSAKAGSHTFTWDGKSNQGDDAAAGNYSFRVTAKQGAEKIDVTPLALGLVSSITRGSSGLSLNIGQQTFTMADVRQIL